MTVSYAKAGSRLLIAEKVNGSTNKLQIESQRRALWQRCDWFDCRQNGQK
jgi:hypothetical protein